MRRLEVGLLVAVAVASALLLARHASHRLVHDYIQARELNDFYGRPPQTTFAEVRDHFAEVTDHLWNDKNNNPISPFYPIARIIGIIDVPAILGAGLIFGLAGAIWGPGRHPKTAAATPTLED